MQFLSTARVRSAVAVAAGLICTAASSQHQTDEEVREALAASLRLMEEAEHAQLPEWVMQEPDVEDVKSVRHTSDAGWPGVARELRNYIEHQQPELMREIQAAHERAQEPLYILISSSLDRTTIAKMMEDAAYAPVPVIFVVRGLLPGEKIDDLVWRTIQWSGRTDLEDMAEGRVEPENLPQSEDFKAKTLPFEVQVDPRPFQQLAVERVPVYVYQGVDGVPRVRRGAASLEYVLESMRDQELDFVIGETREVIEQDLGERIQESLAKVDANALREQARASARAHQEGVGVDLIRADEPYTYLVDPAVTLDRDIVGRQGQVLGIAGQRINPLETMPWRDRQFIIFDPLDRAQVRQAHAWAAERPTTLLLTRMPAFEDDEIYQAIDRIPHTKLYRADEHQVKRFGFEKVPSRAYQEDLMVRVEVAGTGEEL